MPRYIQCSVVHDKPTHQNKSLICVPMDAKGMCEVVMGSVACIPMDAEGMFSVQWSTTRTRTSHLSAYPWMLRVCSVFNGLQHAHQNKSLICIPMDAKVHSVFSGP